jgi:GNAT superfamily N-acetyltransferase
MSDRGRRITMLRVEIVRSLEFAERASRILNESWPPTALHYTPEYLAWQFGFPGASKFPGAAALDGDEPIAFAGATSRQVEFDGDLRQIAIVSFVAVRPAWRRRGIAARLYAPLLTFALGDSAGERTLLAAYRAAGLIVQPLGAYVTYGFLSRPATVASDWEVEEFEGLELPRSVVERYPGAMIRAAGNAEQLAHYRRDPRPRRFLTLRKRGEDAVGGAWIVQSEIVTPQGPEKAIVVDSVYLHKPEPAALVALFKAAGECWGGRSLDSHKPSMIMAPNLWGLEKGILARAGVRASPTKFQAYLIAPKSDEPLFSAQGTNIEIV